MPIDDTRKHKLGHRSRSLVLPATLLYHEILQLMYQFTISWWITKLAVYNGSGRLDILQQRRPIYTWQCHWLFLCITFSNRKVYTIRLRVYITDVFITYRWLRSYADRWHKEAQTWSPLSLLSLTRHADSHEILQLMYQFIISWWIINFQMYNGSGRLDILQQRRPY